MSLLNLGLSGARAAQAAMEMSGRNVANLMTSGYTRQGLLLVSQTTGGVAVSSLIRFADAYRTQQLWSAHSELGQHAAAQSYLDQLEQVMNLDKGSVKASLDKFFNALNEASTDLTSIPLRQQVITSAEALAKSFHHLSRVLSGQFVAVRQHAISMVTQVNALSKSIAKLNEEISNAQGNGGVPSELIDQRDQALDSLAKLADIRVVQQADGTVDVSLSRGQPLVAGKQVAQMSVQDNADGTFSFSLALGTTTYPLTGDQIGGELGGLAGFMQKTLLSQREAVKKISSEIATLFNDQITRGYGTNGARGEPLFEFDSVTGMLKVRKGLTQEQLGFSDDPAKPGDGGNLLRLIGLRESQISLPGFGKKVSLGNAFTLMIGELGSTSSQNKAALATAREIRAQAERNWASVSAVDKDEEAANLIQYQRMYQANMKVIAVANQLFATMLNSF